MKVTILMKTSNDDDVEDNDEDCNCHFLIEIPGHVPSIVLNDFIVPSNLMMPS